MEPKKYTSEAKIILLKQYTSIGKFCSNSPAYGSVFSRCRIDGLSRFSEMGMDRRKFLGRQ